MTYWTRKPLRLSLPFIVSKKRLKQNRTRDLTDNSPLKNTRVLEKSPITSCLVEFRCIVGTENTKCI